MASKLYSVEKHIAVVSGASLASVRLVKALAETSGASRKSEFGWAHSIDQRGLRAIMTTFCQVDIQAAMPENIRARRQSFEHLAAAQAAFAGEDESLRRFYEGQYERFDAVAGPFYKSYGQAFGNEVTPELASATNQLIDPFFDDTERLLGLRGRDFQIARAEMVSLLSAGRGNLLEVK